MKSATSTRRVVSALQIAVVAALTGVVFWKVFLYLAMKWTRDGNWSHGWLIAPLSFYFVWMRREKLLQAPVRPSLWGAVFLTASLLHYFHAYWHKPTMYFRCVALVETAASLVVLFGGWGMLRRTWFPIGYLMLAVPLPHSYYVSLTMPLRRWASFLAGRLLDLLPNVEVEVQRVVIDFIRLDTGYADHLNVEQACSGMRLMMSFLALGAAYAYLMDRPAWQRVGVVLSCVPIAIACNTVRVAVTGYFVIQGWPDLARGTPHMLLGVATLFLALGLFWTVSQVLGRLIIEEPPERDGP